jgi:hypothetical protein
MSVLKTALYAPAGRTAGGRKTANAPGGYSTKTSRYGISPRRKPSA